ncbi:something about silencing protein 10 [Lepeophtheirus salmonis]|uniref:something about silencing protein 10 n=1 Tax=Lepeophtheirus salmonis TaxID=72036 RepID=UPI001AE2B255|nr:something about silencing protein 10-like [Lepeophtheirus salmonis]
MKKKGSNRTPRKKLESVVETYSDDDEKLDLDLSSAYNQNDFILPKKRKKSSLPSVELSDSDVEMEDESDEDEYDTTRSWGRNKNNFYGGNLVSKDPGEDEDEGDEDFDVTEVKESQMMQLKQLQKLDEDDFADMFIPNIANIPSLTQNDETKIKADLGNMSDKEKTELFHQESPEFRSITQDFKEKLKEAKDFLYPAIKLMENGSIPAKGLAARLIKTKFDLIINYCVNIYSYLIFKSRRVQLKSHYSLSGRLVQYKKLLDDLIPLEKEIMKEVKSVVNGLKSENTTIQDLISNKNHESTSSKPIMKPRKKLRILEDTVMTKKVVPVSIEEKLDLNENDLPIEDLDEEYEEEGRRAINYKIAKNKGLTPKRSKLQRNPRVKHRVKFEKAKVRRKGQVRTVRTEVKKYSGEISGINARVKKGIKLA